jgi:hypothetical protein
VRNDAGRFESIPGGILLRPNFRVAEALPSAAPLTDKLHFDRLNGSDFRPEKHIFYSILAAEAPIEVVPEGEP